MQLVLSAFTSSPVSLIATTKASEFHSIRALYGSKYEYYNVLKYGHV
jgi:hypothetical protein